MEIRYCSTKGMAGYGGESVAAVDPGPRAQGGGGDAVVGDGDYGGHRAGAEMEVEVEEGVVAVVANGGGGGRGGGAHGDEEGGGAHGGSTSPSRACSSSGARRRFCFSICQNFGEETPKYPRVSGH